MGHIVKEVQIYRLRVYGKSGLGMQDARAWISFYTSESKDLYATIGFYTTDGFALTKNDNLDEQGIIRGHMHMNEFNAVTNMIRNERPIYVHWSDTLQQMWLDTALPEPVGEEEKSGGFFRR